MASNRVDVAEIEQASRCDDEQRVKIIREAPGPPNRRV